MDEAELCDELVLLRDGALVVTGDARLRCGRERVRPDLDAAFLALVEERA